MYEIVNIGGITLIFSPFKDLETASLGIFIKTGSRYELPNLKGVAHFLEHLLFKGSKDYSYAEIKREIEGRGGSLNGFTSQELTAYYARFLNKNLKPTLDILTDMVSYPLLKEDDIEKERKVILQEIKMYKDLPSPRAVSILEELLWPNHPLGEDVIGRVSTVKKIGRQQLLGFKNNYYLPSNVVISCSANYDKEKIIKLLRKKIKSKTAKAKLITKPPLTLSGVHVRTEKKELQQSHLCLGFRGISYFSKERFVMEVINVILGANMSSRLFEEIREKKALCYDISTEARKYKDSGAFIIHLGLNKEKISIALKSILKQLQKIKKRKVGLNELGRAKDFLLGQTAMGLEMPQGRMFYLAESHLTTGKIYTLGEIKKEIAKITPSRIKGLTNRIFNLKNMCVSCVGDVDASTEEMIKSIVSEGEYD